MKVKSQTSIKIKVKGGDIDTLRSAIKKFINDGNQAGFKNVILSEDEHKLLKNLSDKIE